MSPASSPQHVWRAFLARYCTLDRRSLGLFRIAFGFLLLCDLAYRYAELDTWYTNAGLLPNHVLLWAPPARVQVSLFFSVSTHEQAVAAFALCGLAFLTYTVGFKTRWSQVFALLAIISLNSRLSLLENGGDMVVNILCLLTLFLPLGSRFSVDAWLEAQAGSSGGGLAQRAVLTARPKTEGVQSLACLALILQLATIYFFNFVHKSGQTWQDGSAVHYALHQDRLVTELGLWVRENVPAAALRYATWGTLFLEALAVPLILSPVFTPWTRGLAILLLPALHLGIASCMELGAFSYAMACFFLLLIAPEHWRMLERWSSRFGPKIARSAAPRAGPESAALQTIERSGGTSSRRRLGALPRALGEGAVALVLFAIFADILVQNPSVPKSLRFRTPTFARNVIDYPRILQGWLMFAPDAPTTDASLSVHARTVDGRSVDPYNELGSSVHTGPLNAVEARLGHSQYFDMYAAKLPYRRFEPYRHILEKWILDYHKRTGRPEDRITSFVVYQFTDVSPPLGELAPLKPERHEVLRYPKAAARAQP